MYVYGEQGSWLKCGYFRAQECAVLARIPGEGCQASHAFPREGGSAKGRGAPHLLTPHRITSSQPISC